MTREEYLEFARDSHEGDDLALIERMVVDGLTPWAAARVVAETSNLSQHALYQRARGLSRDIPGQSLDELYERLAREGRLEDPPGHLVADLASRAEGNGLEVRWVSILEVVR